MKYPKLLLDNDLIGITALSSGASDCVEDMDNAINNLKKYFKVLITDNVYGNPIVSSSAMNRVEQFYNLLKEKNMKLIMISRGGDYLYEILNQLDYNWIKKKNIWIEGASDATPLLYILTTKYDLATIYGRNAKQFSKITDDISDNIQLLKNKNIIQKDYNDREIISVNGNFKEKGVIIGGCLDSIKNIIGTKFDNTKNFIKKYKDKKIIWYFDIFAMSSIDVYLTLLQLKYAGWFKYSNTFIFGTIKYPSIFAEITYEDAIKKALFEYDNLVINANIGHVKPCNTIINGSYASIEFKDGNFKLKQDFIEE